MRVLREFKENTENWKNTTFHLSERSERLKHNRATTLHKSFLVDKNHPNGNEVHSVYTDGTIIIYNERTKKQITVLYGRPGQIRRYYESLRLPVPQQILTQAHQNIVTNRNHL